MDINLDLLKWSVMILTAPWWIRFMRMLWNDFNRALAEDGGLIGSPPRPSEVEEIRRQKASEPDLLVSEPWARAQDQRQPRMKTPAPPRAGGGAPSARRAGPAPGSPTRRTPRGFR